ncbi:MAG: DUF4089 domain-containing protein [Rhodoferax sp.]|nr:DUF4089 domain-containing protein [Rhodoferax sp.]
MNESDVLAYVKASAITQGLVLDEARARQVATHLARTAHLAQLLDDVPLGVDYEPAEVYKPLAFPPQPKTPDTP